MNPEEIAELLLDIKAVTLSPSKPYLWTSGIKAPIYCDNRLLMSYPKEWEKVVDSMIELINSKGIKFDIIAGVATGSISHAAMLAYKLKKPMIYVRSKQKEYGKQNQIEGKLEPGNKVLVVEDLISTGGSSLNAVNSVRDAGGVVDTCLAIFTYEMEKSKKAFNDADCSLIVLSNFSTLLKVAESRKYISEKEKESCLEWAKRPDEWP